MNYFETLSPKERIKFYFEDTMTEADELITNGELNAGEVVEAFVDALIESQRYFSGKAQVYQMLHDAINSRFRNK